MSGQNDFYPFSKGFFRYKVKVYGGSIMEINVRLSKSLVLMAKQASKASDRTIKEQLEHWIKIGQLLESNPDLTYTFLRDILKGKEESSDLKELRPFECH
jgi:hypothetical protein